MSYTARINADQRNGNLHIKLNGCFTPEVAAQLIMVMVKVYQGQGNIFIHTDMVTTIEKKSQYAFGSLLEMSDLPRDNIYLTGKNGIKICNDSLKFVVRKKGKEGRCGNCKYNKKAA